MFIKTMDKGNAIVLNIKEDLYKKIYTEGSYLIFSNNTPEKTITKKNTKDVVMPAIETGLSIKLSSQEEAENALDRFFNTLGMMQPASKVLDLTISEEEELALEETEVVVNKEVVEDEKIEEE